MTFPDFIVSGHWHQASLSAGFSVTKKEMNPSRAKIGDLHGVAEFREGFIIFLQCLSTNPSREQNNKDTLEIDMALVRFWLRASQDVPVAAPAMLLSHEAEKWKPHRLFNGITMLPMSPSL